MSAPYAHRLHVNVGGMAQRPVVAMWCSDCLKPVGDFEQVNDLAALQRAADEHRLHPSSREKLRAARGEDRG